MNPFVVTLDLDWACEAAIEETLKFFDQKKIPVTVFATHRSPALEMRMSYVEVGLHPFFDPTSSHGSTIEEVIQHVKEIPHNLPAFRCHQFKGCNQSRRAMQAAGMQISSNVCTDMEILSPFKDRFGLLEVPIFLEDGGYLWQKHPLEITPTLKKKLLQKGLKVLLIHPMHFVLNTPHFEYMVDIKKGITREEWNHLSSQDLNRLRWERRGIKNFLCEILELVPVYSSFRDLLNTQ
jgi:hypothetical protein